MSTMLRPVGPNPPRIYWIRRVVVTVAFLAVVAGLAVGILWVVAFVGAYAAGSPAPDRPAANAAADSKDSAADKGPVIPVDCKATDLELSLVSDAAKYSAAANPMLTATITNTSTKACTVDGGDVNRVVVVRSGGDRIWASKDCAKAETASKQLLLAPGARDVGKISWARVRSTKGCPSDLPAPKAGTYAATVTLLEETAKPVVFTLQ